MDTIHQQQYAQAAKTLSKKLERRNFQPIICQTLAEAKEKALELIESNKVVGFGGSITLAQSGIIPALYDRGQPMIDREKAKDMAEKHCLMKQALTADYFLTSINGISEDGQLVNIDNVGNRVAAITYGPDRVLAFVGMNKVYGDLETTIEMVRKRAAPLNSFRIGLEHTPCVKRGFCGDCLNEECICNTIAVTRRSWIPERITIFLILQNYGL
ncbi:lactate utilization protein [Enterococcus sp. 669A]|uniref:Lactate utilization protein n=1 Tax=Candidatus Enterococcus moelleringii TaxID=2815325 RepID=A0ABS3LBQ0_9ENTE|nr:lactate utilization protein [Enterococcus sp. 669A]MBO1307060.1 lactate utilization protein [Enterococcus sp. 669A]